MKLYREVVVQVKAYIQDVVELATEIRVPGGGCPELYPLSLLPSKSTDADAKIFGTFRLGEVGMLPYGTGQRQV